MSGDEEQITRLLRSVSGGDQADQERLLQAIYDDLKRIAAGQLKNERAAHTLNPTALVHEAYIRLIDQRSTDWNDRLHFFSIAARIIRRVLVDHARQRNALKRGGKGGPIALEHADPAAPEHEVDLLELDEALAMLAEISERQARVVELRYFGGLTIPEIAEALDTAPRTVDREWSAARAWLFHRLSKADPSGPNAD